MVDGLMWLGKGRGHVAAASHGQISGGDRTKVKFSKFRALLAFTMVLTPLVGAHADPAPQAKPPSPAPAMPHRGPTWPVEPRWTGPGPMPRHYVALMWGIPAPYTSMTNPLPRSGRTLESGAAIYRQHCASCHGDDGAGGGPAGRNLKPPPGNLVWLSDMPEKQWDAFMVWSITDGGAPLGTAMPAFKDTLSREDIWAVTAYVQASLPYESQWRMRLR